MRISVRVRPNAREERVEKIDDVLTVYVKEPPKDNKANRRLIKLLSEYFKVPKSQIFIASGMKSNIIRKWKKEGKLDLIHKIRGVYSIIPSLAFPRSPISKSLRFLFGSAVEIPSGLW